MRNVKLLVLIVVASTGLSCKKSIKVSFFEKYFEQNVLNSNYVITYARDNGDEITSQFENYVFVLKKGSDYYHGPLTVTQGGTTYNGSWSSNEDYGKLVIMLPGSPAEFNFLNREWRFTSKNIPVLKFAPWGSNADIALTMERK